MATTGTEVFKLAMALIDEITDAGLVSTTTANYQAKAPMILTILEAELCKKENIANPAMITSLIENVHVSDYTARLVMPYGLATHLMLDENPSTATFFNGKYEEFKRKIPTSFVAIPDVYADGGDV